MAKITLKNAMVYDFMRSHLDDGVHDVKTVFMAHKDEIARRFNITTYATFNHHVRKCRDWENDTGNKISVIRMDNEGVV